MTSIDANGDFYTCMGQCYYKCIECDFYHILYDVPSKLNELECSCGHHYLVLHNDHSGTEKGFLWLPVELDMLNYYIDNTDMRFNDLQQMFSRRKEDLENKIKQLRNVDYQYSRFAKLINQKNARNCSILNRRDKINSNE